jgi:hypothetical protein
MKSVALLKGHSKSRQLEEKCSLVIISGLPRSGTTWIGKLFDSHPRTIYRHEPDSVKRLEWLPLIVENDYYKYETGLRDFVCRLPAIRNPKVAASLPVFAKEFMPPTRRILVKYLLHLVKALAAVGLKVDVPYFCIPNQDSDYVLVWKTVESSTRLGLYAETLFNKQIISIFRHPCGIISSRLRGERLNKFGGYSSADDYDLFNVLLQTSLGLRSGLSLNQIKAMDPVERLAWLTIASMEKAYEDIEGQPDCQMVIYEDLCTRPYKTLSQLFEFCGLDLNPQTWKFLDLSISKTNQNYYSIFKHPLDSAYKWKKELHVRDQKLICKYLQHSRLAQLWPD